MRNEAAAVIKCYQRCFAPTHLLAPSLNGSIEIDRCE